MSEPKPIYHTFQDSNDRIIELGLPFLLDALCDEYDALTARLARRAAPDAFGRDEWGYLLSFLRGSALRRVFTQCFGPAL